MLIIPPPQIFVKCFMLNLCYIFVRDFICFIKVFMKIVLENLLFLYILSLRVSLLYSLDFKDKVCICFSIADKTHISIYQKVDF